MLRKPKRWPSLHLISILILTLASNTPASSQVIGHDKLQQPVPVLNKFSMHFTISDLAIPSHDLPIAFTRTYNSAFTKEASSPLGLGWTHSYQMGLQIEEEEGFHPERAIFTDSTDRRYAFERRLDGSYITPPIIKATLEEDLHRTRYTLTFKDRTQYLFNQDGRLEAIRTQNNNTLTFAYSEGNRLVSVVSSAGARLDFEYDAQGWLTQIKDSAGRTVRYLHDEQGRLIKAVDFLGAEVGYSYDEVGRLASITDALGRTATVAYNAIGNLESITDAAGGTTRYEFIGSGWFYTEKGPTSYFPNRVTATDPLGNKTVTEYNDLGNPLMLQDKEGNKTFYTWDRAGDLTGVIDPERGRTELVWDESSNLIAVQDPSRNKAELLYDGQDRLIEYKDPKGNITEYTYDKQGRLAEIRSPEGGVTRITYTPEGNVSAYQDPMGHTTILSADSMGRPVARTDAKGNSIRCEYNGRSELTKVINAQGQAKEIRYDRTERQTTVLYPDGKEYRYLYDPAGRLIRAKGPDGTLAIEYNALDLPVQVTDAEGKVIQYEYDALGRRTQMIDPSGREHRYAYDKRDNLIELIQPNGEVIRFEYDKAGRRTAVIFPNSVKASTRYDLAGSVLEIKYENLQTKEVISRVRYYYDELGNCVSKIDGQGETIYQYDKLSRLVEVVQPDGETTVYAYDKAGNRLVKGAAGVREDSTYNELNQLLAQGKTTYQYDPAGHLVIKQENEKATRYRYDFDGLLEEAVLPDGRAMEYRYDPLGRRISKTTPEGTTRYAYDAEDILLELDGQNHPTRSYTHGPGIDDLLGSRDLTVNEESYFLTDRLSSITAVLDQAGATRSTFTYDPFGQVTSSVIARPEGPKQSRLSQPYLFTGRQFDPETGLYYYRNRYYAPESGRFTTPDPIGLLGGPNLYTYVGNNPINLADPFGLRGEKRAQREGALGIYRDPSVLGVYRGDPVIYKKTDVHLEAIGWVGGKRAPLDVFAGRFLEGTTRIIVYGDPATMRPSSWIVVVWSKTGGGWASTQTPEYGWEAIPEAEARELVITKEAIEFFNRQRQVPQFGNEGAGVPEPPTMVLAMLGIAMLVIYRRRSRKRACNAT